MATQLKLRRDTAANWSSVNPVLALGEPAVESDTACGKVGDGTLTWNVLPYAWGVKSPASSVRTLVPSGVSSVGGSVSSVGGKVTFTGVTSVSVSGLFTAALGAALVDLQVVGSTSAQALSLRLRAGGTDDSGSYVNQVLTGSGSTASAVRNSVAMCQLGSVSSAARTAAQIRLWAAGVAAPSQIQATVIDSTATSTLTVVGCLHAPSTAFDGLTLYAASGTITGTLAVHGFGA